MLTIYKTILNAESEDFSLLPVVRGSFEAVQVLMIWTKAYSIH